jgi:hypothetical protein
MCDAQRYVAVNKNIFLRVSFSKSFPEHARVDALSRASCSSRRLAVVVPFFAVEVRKNGDSLLKEVITLSDLATLCVCSERTIQRLTKQGVLRLAKDRQRRIMRGRYELGDAMPRFVEHLRDSIPSDDPNARAYVEARARRMLFQIRFTIFILPLLIANSLVVTAAVDQPTVESMALA